jgi:SAM-dependent methyltransferase
MNTFRKSHTQRSVSPDVYDNESLSDLRGYREFQTGAFHDLFYRSVQLAEPLEGKTTLDIGCGRGEAVFLCAQRGCCAYGIDYSETAIAMANEFIRKNLDDEVRDRIVVQRMDAKRLSFNDGTFDAVFMVDVVEHLYPDELRLVLGEIARVLKPDGTLIIHTSPNKYLMAAARTIAHLFGVTMKSDATHVNEQSVTSLKSVLRGAYAIQRIWIEKDRNFWSQCTVERSAAVRFVARLVDFIVDNPFSEYLIKRSFLKFYVGNNIWAIARKEQNTVRPSCA